MAELTEPKRAGEFIASESNGARSRETVTIASGSVVYAGQVLGQVTKEAVTAAAVTGNTGNGAMGEITLGSGAMPGDYTLTVVETTAGAGAFVVEAPNGVTIGNGDVATAFSAGGLSFTLADGATDFAAGDQFIITVAEGSLEYVPYNQDGTNGSEVAAGIAYDNVDASDSDVLGVAIVRDAELNGHDLLWPVDLEAGEQTTAEGQLAALGIIVRY